MRARAATVGLLALFVAVAAGVMLLLAHPRKQVRYVGVGALAGGAPVEASVSLRLDAASAPSEVTLDLGGGGRVVARRLP